MIPKPIINLTRFQGVFAPHSHYRARVTKQRCARENKGQDDGIKTEAEKKNAMRWAIRLKRAFNIDINTRERCGGEVQVIACIKEEATIKKLFDTVKLNNGNHQKMLLRLSRAPP